MRAMVTYNDYYHIKVTIKEPGKDEIRYQDPSSVLDETEDLGDKDYKNPCKVGTYSLEEDFKRKTKKVF